MSGYLGYVRVRETRMMMVMSEGTEVDASPEAIIGSGPPRSVELFGIVCGRDEIS